MVPAPMARWPDGPKAGYLLGFGAVQSILGFTPR